MWLYRCSRAVRRNIWVSWLSCWESPEPRAASAPPILNKHTVSVLHRYHHHHHHDQQQQFAVCVVPDVSWSLLLSTENLSRFRSLAASGTQTQEIDEIKVLNEDLTVDRLKKQMQECYLEWTAVQHLETQLGWRQFSPQTTVGLTSLCLHTCTQIHVQTNTLTTNIWHFFLLCVWI